jgi:hypothetical protein
LELTGLDFGEEWEDPEFVHSVTLTNRTERDVRVTGMSGGCECTAVEPQAFCVAPGGAQQLRVKIDLTHRFPYQFGFDRRELAVMIRPTFADRGLAAEGWTVRGVVKSRVSIDGRELAFGDLCGQGESATRAMKVTAHVPLAKLEAACPIDVAQVSVIAAKRRPGGYDVRVTPNPELPLGPFRFEVALTATTPDGTKHRCVAFGVAGEMRSPVRITPEPVLLGEHLVGSIAEAVVSVRFPVAGWSVDRVETERTDTNVTLLPDSLNAQPSYRIAQAISKPGDGTCQVRFVCRKPTGQLETVPATVRWFGETRPKEKP